jgi:hypothetical protein
LSVGLITGEAALAGDAGDIGRTNSETPASRNHAQIQTPMTGKGVGVAPYSVRLRITGFLARQHAREGDVNRALAEYHSMLEVDDPAWPDNEEGDSLRIARDIEVAQMMSESGFYDHAIRVLQTSLILARVNGDPQASVVERQMHVTAELAQVKGVAVPLIDLSYPDGGASIVHSPAIEPSPAARVTVTEPVTPTSSEIGSPVAGRTRESSPPLPSSLSEIQSSEPSPREFSETMVVEEYPKEKSWLSRLIPSRRHHSRNFGPEATTAAPARPLTSPDVSPTYCPECSGLHHRSGSHAQVMPRETPRPTYERIEPRAVSSSTISSENASYPEPDNGRRGKRPSLISRLFGKRRSSDVYEQPMVASPPSHEVGPLVQPPALADSSDLKLESNSQQPVEAEKPLTLTQLDQAPASSRRIDSEYPEVEMTDDGLALQSPGVSSVPDSNSIANEPVLKPAVPNSRRQVGVAGQVTSPGIFTLEGNSTTLAALLRRTGDGANGSAKRTRIVRSVDLRKAAETIDLSKDFYLQRVDVIQPAGAELDTPIYGQELVIVDGAGQKPIYIAVMPHFILQVPTSTGYLVTAEQIVDQFRVYWPNIRQQEIGVVRFEQWSRASKLARTKDGDDSVDTPLQAGDVVYVDGVNLDPSQVMSAAEAIARLAGAKIRLPDSSVQPASGSK